MLPGHMLFGAFRPQTTTEDKKSQTPSEAALPRLAVGRAGEGSAVSSGSPTLYRQNREGALLVSTSFPHGDDVE